MASQGLCCQVLHHVWRSVGWLTFHGERQTASTMQNGRQFFVPDARLVLGSILGQLCEVVVYDHCFDYERPVFYRSKPFSRTPPEYP